MKGILKLPIIIWSFLTLAAYASVMLSPEIFKYSGLVSLAIPFMIIGNIVLLLLGLFTKPKRALIPLVLLVFGFSFITATISLDASEEHSSDIKVMSYNLMRMNKLGREKDVNSLKEWLSNQSSDIKCIQEFLAKEDILEAMSKSNTPYGFIGGYGSSYAIYSKWPIINQGVFYEANNTNNILFADIKRGDDTLRVYNVHLQSMKINVERELINKDEREANYNSVRIKFQKGSVRRAEQIADLLEHVKACTYPILIVGDFNDTPYSYNYFKISNGFNNAFENAGRGFGFTYNGKLPFLRIDNQFYNDGFGVHDFVTLDKIDYSDHFPIVGIYSISD